MEPFIGEIRIFPYLASGKAPNGWATCNGQLLNIQQNAALYAILGTRFGGDGQSTFALPDLRGRAPMCPSSTYPFGVVGQGGTNTSTLTLNNIPAHTHQMEAVNANATTPIPLGNTISNTTDLEFCNRTFVPNPSTNIVQMNAAAVGTAGGSQGVSNMQPFLGLVFCIATIGIFPPRD